MSFDKNQIEFPTTEHKQVWNCGVLILPEKIVLSDKVRTLMDTDLFESCKQMRLFMLHSLSDMYNNAESYKMNPQKYLVFWFNISSIVRQYGELLNNRLIIYFANWKNKIQRNRYISEMTDECYKKIFSGTGVQIKFGKESVEITSSLYPKMFCAMREMRDIVSMRKEKSGSDNSFYYCDFRKLCSAYKYDTSEKKSEKENNINEIEYKIPTLLDGDMKMTALNFVAYLREKKMPPKYAGINNAWKIDYKGKCLLYIRLCDLNPSGEKKKWVINPYLLHIQKYEDLIINEGLQNFIWDNMHHCINVLRGGCNSHNCSPGKNITLLGKEIKSVCRGRQPVWFFDPDKTAIDCIKKLLEFEKNARMENIETMIINHISTNKNFPH